jgi:threonine dehydrogenase-like Zn-dependent dehydrogenase
MVSVRAAVMERPGNLAVREFPMPEPEPGAVVMRVSYSGICGTDKHTFRGESKQYAGTDHERDLTYPLICGHENVGRVSALAGTVLDSEGQTLRVGDRIVPGANVPCGHCHYCINNYPYYFCLHMEDYGNSLHCGKAPYLFGGWAEHMYLLPGTPLFRVPDDLPDSVAVLTEIMAVTHGVETALSVLGMTGAPRFGVSVAVLGVGPLGLCHLIKARLLGASNIFATDRFASRLALAEAFGAELTMVVDETEQAERVARVKERTGGLGADIVLSCSGVPSTFVEALKMVRVGGVVVEAGTFVDMGPVGINPNSDICTRNVTVIGVGGETATSYLPVMRLMAANLNRLPFERFVSHRFALDQAQHAVELAQTDAAIKVVMAPNGTSD